MNNKIFFLFIIIVTFLIVFSMYLFYENVYKVFALQEYEMTLEVVEKSKVGLAIIPGKISFGKVPLGGSSEREIKIRNNFLKPLNLELLVKGNITKFVSFNISKYIIQPNETLSLKIIATIPENATLGKYNGKLYIVLKK